MRIKVCMKCCVIIPIYYILCENIGLCDDNYVKCTLCAVTRNVVSCDDYLNDYNIYV